MVFAAVLASCASGGNFSNWDRNANTMPPGAFQRPGIMAPVLTFRGFQALKPTTDRWILRFMDQDSDQLILRIRTDSPSYSVYFYAHASELPKAPASREEFEQQVKDVATQIIDKGRLEVLSMVTRTREQEGVWRVDFVLKVLDRRPVNSETPLVISDEGRFLLAPGSANAVRTGLSQRGRESEILTTLDADMAALLDGVSLTSSE